MRPIRPRSQLVSYRVLSSSLLSSFVLQSKLTNVTLSNTNPTSIVSTLGPTRNCSRSICFTMIRSGSLQSPPPLPFQYSSVIKYSPSPHMPPLDERSGELNCFAIAGEESPQLSGFPFMCAVIKYNPLPGSSFNLDRQTATIIEISCELTCSLRGAERAPKPAGADPDWRRRRCSESFRVRSSERSFFLLFASGRRRGNGRTAMPVLWHSNSSPSRVGAAHACSAPREIFSSNNTSPS